MIKKIIGILYYIAYKIGNRCNHYYLYSNIRGNIKTLALRGRIKAFFPEKIMVGKNVCINEGVFIHARGGVVLSDNVTISAHAQILTREYNMENWREQCKIGERQMEHIEKEVFLGEHTWIGAGAIICPGVKITGKGVVVAAGSVVTKDIAENYVLVAGTPGKIVKYY